MKATAGVRICPTPHRVQVYEPEPLPRFGFGDLTDDGIVRVLRQYRRAIEDGADPAKYRPMIRTGRLIQLARFALHMRYGATFFGTDSYDQYMRHGESPCYWLAQTIDHHHAAAGHRHVLDGRVHFDGIQLSWPTPERVS